MIAQRAAIAFLGATSLTVLATPVTAQISDEIVLNIMRECARIDEPSARLACYDNNIRNAGANPRMTVPGETVVTGGPGAPMSGGGAQGFGREDVQSPGRFQAPPGELQELSARVSGIRQVGAGRYVITLEDGAVWRFTDSVPTTYSVPRVGSEVEINRASLGSFLLRFRNQQSVRVERVR